MTKIDGGTKGPSSYSGSIGKRLTGCEDLPVVKFEKISFSCPNNLGEIAHTLSSDQKYLFDICTAVSRGDIPNGLAKRSAGNLSTSRWYVTANRILRVYVSDPTPSFNLRTMARYVMSSYALILFDMKYKSSIVYAPIHLTNMILSSRWLPPNWLDIVRATIQRNAYYAHPEHIVLTMANDPDENIRKMAWGKILAARRSTESSENTLRQFKVPELNFDCTDYITLIDVPMVVDPPILKDIEVTESRIDFLVSKPILEHDFGQDIANMPLHTQAVERCVKLVTEASASVCGESSRDGHISNTIASRNVMEKFETKRDYQYSKEINCKLKL